MKVNNGGEKMQHPQTISNLLSQDFKESRRYFALLNRLGVPVVDLRAFSKHAGTIRTKCATDENGFESARNWILANNLSNQTVNCTFNVIQEEALQTNSAVGDNDISYYRFIFIDIDSIKAIEKASASEKEKAATQKLAEEVVTHLKAEDFTDPIIIDSGNGTHVLIPFEQNKLLKSKNSFKKFLKILSNKFSNEYAQIDTCVFNPSRLGKLVGTPATKGESTEERPHRLSKLVVIPNEIVDTTLSTVEAYIAKYEGTVPTNATVGRDTPDTKERSVVFADAEKWLAYYSLPFHVKDGDKKGVKLYIFDHCPLTEHTNNQNGSCMVMNEDGRCEFRCLHESDSKKGIADFAAKYPLPEEAKFIPPLITVEALNRGETFKRGKFTLTLKGLNFSMDEGEVRCADPLFVSKITVNRDTKITMVTIVFYANGIWNEIEVGAEQLTTVNMKKLARYNVSFRSRLEPEVCDFLNITKSELPVEFVHEKIGWTIDADGKAFLLDRTYSADDDYLQSMLSTGTPYCFDSYGNRQVYDEMIATEVLGTNMEIALCIGLTSLFVGYFKATGQIDIPGLVISVKGGSTTGKSTSLVLVASLYGAVQTIVRNFNATQAALIKLASDNHGGVPMILDELGSTNIQDLSTFIHQFSSGRERLRMNKNRELDQQLTIETVLLLSSERSLDNYVDDTEGQVVRRLEFSLPQWTKNAESSEKIKSVCFQNGGFVIKEVINGIFDKGPNCLVEWFNDARKELLPSMEDTPLKDRFANNLALVKASGKLIDELLGWKLDHQKIEDSLLDVYHQTIENHFNKENNYIDRVVQLLLLNANHFIVAGNQRNTGSTWGKVTLMEAGVKVNILQQQFRNVLKREFNTPDVDPILNYLLAEGILKTEKDRKTKRVRINKVAYTTYEVVLPTETAEFFKLQTAIADSSFLFNPVQPTSIVSDIPTTEDDQKMALSMAVSPLEITEDF